MDRIQSMTSRAKEGLSDVKKRKDQRDWTDKRIKVSRQGGAIAVSSKY